MIAENNVRQSRYAALPPTLNPASPRGLPAGLSCSATAFADGLADRLSPTGFLCAGAFPELNGPPAISEWFSSLGAGHGFSRRSELAMVPLATGRSMLVAALMLLCFSPVIADEAPKGKPDPAAGPVSYYKQIRPIFQANCQGCHQPAKARGDYVMTAFDKLLAGGESGTLAVVAGHTEKSLLIEQITPQEGKAKMPQGKKPLDTQEIDLVRRWIAQGAVDDTPANARVRYDMEHPPVYTRPP